METPKNETRWHVYGDGHIPQPGAARLYEIAWSEAGELVVEGVYGRQNAEFIVRACNAHEELVEAGNAALKLLGKWLNLETVTKEDKAVIDTLCFAITKAEAKESKNG